MRIIASLLLIFALSGCMSSGSIQEPPTAAACPANTRDAGSTEGKLLRVYTGNDGGRATCLNITIDGALFFSAAVATEPPGLHANGAPGPVTHWPGAAFTVVAHETARGLTAEKRITAAAENHVVVLVNAAGISIQNYEREPQFG